LLGLWVDFTGVKAVKNEDYGNGKTINFKLEFVVNPFRTEDEVIRGIYPKYS